MNSKGFIPVHGGYEDLLSFQKARIIYDGTVKFCERFLQKRDRTYDQMTKWYRQRVRKTKHRGGHHGFGDFQRSRNQADERRSGEPGGIAGRLSGFFARARRQALVKGLKGSFVCKKIGGAKRCVV